MAVDKAPRSGHPLWNFAIRALIAVGIVVAAFLLWKVRYTALMAFGAVIVAVLLLALSDLLRRWIPRHRWRLAAAVTLILLVLVGLGWLTGSQIRLQFSELWQKLPQGLRQIEQWIGVPLIGGENAGARAAEAGRGGTEAATPIASRVGDWIASYGVSILNAVVGIILVVIAGVYLAAEPDLYRRGSEKLFPPPQHARISAVLFDMGQALRSWLVAELIAMLIVGVLVGLGTWMIGLPAPLALALFAGLTEFVPIVGPIIGAVPALILALSQGGSAFVWTLLLFVAVQQLESNVIAPLVIERVVSIPPALFLLSVAAFGGLFGIIGVILAGPLTVAAYVAVQKLWVRDTLHEETDLAGQSAGSSS